MIFYTNYINSYEQKLKKDKRNTEILKALKKLGAKEIKSGKK